MRFSLVKIFKGPVVFGQIKVCHYSGLYKSTSLNLTICRINVNTCKYGDLLQLLGVSSCDAEPILDVRYCKCYLTVEDLPWNGYTKVWPH